MKERLDISAGMKADKRLAFIRYAINPERFEAPAIDEKEWKQLCLFASAQKISGLLLEGVEQLQTQGTRPPEEVLEELISQKLAIEKHNVKMNYVTAKLVEMLENDGFRCCVLKGQGNNLMYPNVYSRISGDIDVWMSSTGDTKHNVRDIIRYVRKFNASGKAVYHHINYGMFGNTEVEVHYRPSFMNNPIHNYRLQKWFNQQADAQFSTHVELPGNTGTIAVPTPEFNAVYQLAHIYNHILNIGTYLRHVVDYYYVMMALKDRENIEPLLRYLGLEEIARAMMWVLNSIIGMEEKYMIVPPDERLGRVLAEEVLRSKDFMQDAKGSLDRNIRRLRIDMRMVRYFPSECLCEPIFRLHHFFWRLFI